MNKDILQKELKFKAIRSSGPGGQHANKVASKVILYFDLNQSKAFPEKEKELLYKNLKPRLSKENILILSTEETRSQHRNKEIVILKFNKIILSALKTSKKRKRTKPSKSSIEKRLRKKKKLAFKKLSRQNPTLD